MTLEVVRPTTEEDALAAVKEAGPDAVIVQLPLPAEFDAQKILDAIPLEKDADVLSSQAYARFEAGGGLVPPVAGAVMKILTHAGVSVAGKKAVVIGEGRLVGKPVAVALARAGAAVAKVSTSTQSKDELYRDADIIVAGAGVAHLVTPDLVKEGVVLIDAGTSESNGSIAGDLDPACAAKASVFTPVPGGVGPVAVAILFRNVSRLLEGE
jgi:methylenetetrahydrofolate dehydrogenase (NADP+)/methenyltetrahydrofolate cyclohydrolase